MAVVLVTGGAGFIGRELVFQLYERGHHIVVVDKGTYAARFDLLRTFRDRLSLVEWDVRELDHLFGADVVFHLAAESHVDNSITDGGKFVDSNVGGTLRLLEVLRGVRPHDRPVLIHVSTDEVYGDLGPEETDSMEEDRLLPSSPYAASKAAADMLVMAWARTYGVRSRIVRPSNCYGVGQYPEKLIPKTVRSYLTAKAMTIHGDGTQTRSWLAVEDCARALRWVWDQGQDDEVYNIPGNSEVSVRSLVKRINEICSGATYPSLDRVVAKEPIWGCERPGGDRRYRVDGSRLRRLGWEAKGDLMRDLEKIVRQELETGIHI